MKGRHLCLSVESSESQHKFHFYFSVNETRMEQRMENTRIFSSSVVNDDDDSLWAPHFH